MRCYIYKGRRKPDTYLYLTSADNFAAVPGELMKAFGEMEQVMDLALSPGRRLAREDVRQVLSNLLLRGFHVQLPPPDEPLSRTENETPELDRH